MVAGFGAARAFGNVIATESATEDGAAPARDSAEAVESAEYVATDEMVAFVRVVATVVFDEVQHTPPAAAGDYEIVPVPAACSAFAEPAIDAHVATAVSVERAVVALGLAAVDVGVDAAAVAAAVAAARDVDGFDAGHSVALSGSVA